MNCPRSDCSRITTRYWGRPKPCLYCMKCVKCGNNGVKSDADGVIKERVWKINNETSKFICDDHRKDEVLDEWGNDTDEISEKFRKWAK